MKLRTGLVVFILIFSAVAIPIIFIKNNNLNGNEQASWYNTDWRYKKSISIENASADYQMNITIGYASGGNVTLDSKCKTNFGDIRFVNSTDQSELPYWLESMTDSVNATFWVKTDGASSLNIYYGNPEAVTASNFNNTFIFGELWDSTSLDTAKWNSVDGGMVYSIDTTNHYLNVTNTDDNTWDAVGTYGFHNTAALGLPSSWQITNAYNDSGVPMRIEITGSSKLAQGYILFNDDNTLGVGEYNFKFGSDRKSVV